MRRGDERVEHRVAQQVEFLTAINGAAAPAGRLRIELVDDLAGPAWIEVVGEVVRTGRGTVDRPDVRLRGRTHSVVSLLSGDVVGADAVDGVEIAVGDGPWCRHIPFDVGAQPELDEPVPFADLVLQHHCRDTFAGDLSYWERFEDGRLVERRCGSNENADVSVTNTYRLLVRGLDPALDSLDAITGMTVDGTSEAMVMLFAGLYDDRRLRRHLDQHRATNRAMVDVAALTRSHSWRAALGLVSR